MLAAIGDTLKRHLQRRHTRDPTDLPKLRAELGGDLEAATVAEAEAQAAYDLVVVTVRSIEAELAALRDVEPLAPPRAAERARLRIELEELSARGLTAGAVLAAATEKRLSFVFLLGVVREVLEERP
jgi:hypothetical protein